MVEHSEFCTFRCGNYLLGLDIHLVAEILHEQSMSRVLGVSEHIAGLLQRRGQIVTVINLNKILGFPDIKLEHCKYIILKEEQAKISLLVESIEDVVQIHTSQKTNLPQNLPANLKEYFTAFYRYQQELLIVLNIEKILQYRMECL